MKKRGIKIISMYIVLVLTLTIASAIGVTNVVPGDIELLPGESADFVIGISTSAESAYSCTYSMQEGDFPLEVLFDEDPFTVQANSDIYVFGRVSAPTALSYDSYQGQICIECTPEVSEGTGAGVKYEMCNPVINVNVVAERSLVNTNVRPETPFPWWLWLLLLLVLILLILIGSILYKKYKQRMQK